MIIKNESIYNELVESSYDIFVGVIFETDYCGNLQFSNCTFVDCLILSQGLFAVILDQQNYTGDLSTLLNS